MSQNVPVAGRSSPSVPTDDWQRYGEGCEHEATRRPPLLVPAVQLTRHVDYIALYEMFRISAPYARNGRATLLRGERGVVCETSTDRSACEARVQPLLAASADCMSTGACARFAIVTTGDEVRRIDERAEFIALLGPIDGPEKAAVLAFWEGITIACPLGELRGTEIKRESGQWIVRSEWEDCGPRSRDTIRIDDDGTVVSNTHEPLGHSGCTVGRRPQGLRASLPTRMPTALGAYLANNAQLEAASVFAFERLTRELSQLAAPNALILAAAAAALDEVRHTQLVTELARRFGAEPSAPAVSDPGQRSRFDIALENAVEGCVRETFGALLAHHQAALAQDPAVMSAMTRIAEDETRHAELAWRVAEWLEPQLSAAERVQLAEARATAFSQLRNELTLEGLSAQDSAALGWPSAQVAAELLGLLAVEGASAAA